MTTPPTPAADHDLGAMGGSETAPRSLTAGVEPPGPPPLAAGARFAVMAGSLAVLLGAMVAIVVVRNGGTFTYAIDDSMIHLTIARNLGRHATFGVVPGVYESASSAPAWNVLLAPLLAIVPDGWWWPLVLNVAAALWLLRTVSALEVLDRFGSRALTLTLCLVTPVLLGLVPLILTGMEHTLHAAIAAAFLVVLARIGSVDERRHDVAWCVALLAVGTLVRFETGFLAAAAAVVLVLDGSRHGAAPGAVGGRRRWTLAASFVAAVVVPAALFGAVNLAFGQFALPSSVVAKSDLGTGLPIPDPSAVLSRITTDPVLMVVVATSALALVHARLGQAATDRTRVASRAVAVVLLTSALHVCFAETGWFERYQAYLIIGSVVALGILAPALAGWPRWRTGVGLAVVALCLLRIPLLANTPAATFNRYQNQYQLGRFLAAEYQGTGIAINDLGWVSWLHEGPILDVVGLGSVEALRATRAHELDAERFAELAAEQDVRVVAVYERFFAPLIPPGWEEAGRWCVPEGRYLMPAECIAFYARSGADADAARAALERYAPSLPPETVSTITPG